jgi:predicted AlkP superfamily pyrophosphatase or phosphodiesterase
MTFPDYNRSVLNVACSVLEMFGAEPPHGTLPELTGLARKSQVALVILDGMGMDALTLLPEDAFLRRHRIAELTSVFPSTTTAATGSLYSALSPAEHGWLGWSCYFKEYARLVDLFLDRDSYTLERLTSSPAKAMLRYDSVFTRIKRAAGEKVLTRAVFPFEPSPLTGMDELVITRTLDEAALAIRSRDGREAFTLFYWTDPDDTMHNHGARSGRAVKALTELNAWAEALASKLRDTTLIITADHGLIDVTEPVWLNEQKEIMRCLVMPPSMESRASSLFVKRGREREFENAFREALGADFLPMSREEALSRQLFGPGKLHDKADDFLGDYLALATGTRAIYYRAEGAEPHGKMIGHHAGLTEQEMLVPLIAV